MSRINPASSASGVRVAAQPLSNVYTVLLIIGFIALTLALVMLWVTLDQRYGSGVSFAVTEDGKTALGLPAVKMAEQVKYNADLDAKDKTIKEWPGGPAPVVPAVPAVPAAPVAPVAPAAGGPEGAAPAAPAVPTTPAPEGGAAPAAPVAP